jgi:deazaflavin-dependent oxidoreductase (nitroreductase family)
VQNERVSDFNTQIIDEFRNNGGHVETAGFGDNLLLLHTVGAKSGEPRISPLMALPDGDAWLIIGSYAGSPKNPAWVHNVRSEPSVSVEIPGDEGVRTITAVATELGPEDRERAWQSFVAASEQFQNYTETAEGRVFPIFRITPA